MSTITRSTHAMTNDDRLATWAFRYFGSGLHRRPDIQFAQREPTAQPGTPVPASLCLAPAGVSVACIHSSPCGCCDDAQRHWALVARDLMAQGRESELTDDMRQAYDYEFGGVHEPEAPRVPEF